jgi:DNA integrity scanning protein DisA with diadenylate cyclase activity
MTSGTILSTFLDFTIELYCTLNVYLTAKSYLFTLWRAMPKRTSSASGHLLKAAFELANSLKIEKMLVQAEKLPDTGVIDKYRRKEKIVWLVRDPEGSPTVGASDDSIITIPQTTTLTRLSQIKIGLFYALLADCVGLDENILCLSGASRYKGLDTLIITRPRRELPWLHRYDVDQELSVVAARELGRIIDISLRFAAEGREGKNIGTIFVVGKPEQLASYLRQLVLNPCEGHPPDARDIHNPQCLETLREFAALDGAFIISESGIVESAGTYLDAPAKKLKLRLGLGARHAAAASITTVTDAVSVVLSESSGTVSVFRRGKLILELEKPEPSLVGRKSG